MVQVIAPAADDNIGFEFDRCFDRQGRIVHFYADKVDIRGDCEERGAYTGAMAAFVSAGVDGVWRRYRQKIVPLFDKVGVPVKAGIDYSNGDPFAGNARAVDR